MTYMSYRSYFHREETPQLRRLTNVGLSDWGLNGAARGHGRTNS